MEQKTSKIEKCKFIRLWNNPNGRDLYYHELTLANGDIGNVGTVDKYPDKIEEGRVISYTIKGDSIKLVSVETIATQSQGSGGSPNHGKKQKGNSGGGGGRAKSQADYLGFSYSYAKDLVIAGKTTKKDIDALKKIAEEIYAHVGELFHKGSLADQVKENPLGPYKE